jgi:phosphatidylglycerophosphate synthase
MNATPIREAIVFTDPRGGRAIAGVPLLVRTMLVLQRAGVERCTLVGGARPPGDGRIRLAVTAVASLVPPDDSALRLVIGPGAVIDETLVRDLQARARPGEVLAVEHEGAQVAVAPGPRVLDRGGHRHRPSAGTLASAQAPPTQVEHALLRALENPRDGYLDRLLYRHFSRPLTRLLARTRVSPNAVTLVGIGLGALGGLLFAVPGGVALLAAVPCLLASGVLDCSDGELARLRFAESRLGHWLDVSGDTIVHVCLLAGIAARIAATGQRPDGWVLAALAAGVVGSFAVTTWSEHHEARRQRVRGWENRLLDNVLSPLSTRDWYVFVVAFTVAGRLEWLVPAAAVGAQVFWIVGLVALVRVLGRVPRLQSPR